MAFKGINFTCSTTAQACWTFTGTADAMQTVIIQNDSGETVTVGGPDVEDGGKGISIADGETMPIPGYSGDMLYIIAASGTPVVQILANRV